MSKNKTINYTSKRGNNHTITGKNSTGYNYDKEPVYNFDNIDEIKTHIEQKEFIDNYAKENY